MTMGLELESLRDGDPAVARRTGLRNGDIGLQRIVSESDHCSDLNEFYLAQSVQLMVRSGEFVLRPACNFLFLSEEDDLAVSCDFEKQVEYGAGAFRVGMDCHVIEKKWARVVSSGYVIGECDSQQKVDLFGGPMGEQFSRSPWAGFAAHLHLQGRWINDGVRVPSVGDFRQPMIQGLDQYWCDVAVYPILGVSKEISGPVESVFQFTNAHQVDLGVAKRFLRLRHAGDLLLELC